jgi:hypothetical protein
MTNYAQIEERSSFLFSDFGENLARQWFGNETVDALPKFQRGKHKGKPKGVLVWQKVVKGGWVREGFETGYVENRVGHVIKRQLREMADFASGERYGKLIEEKRG